MSIRARAVVCALAAAAAAAILSARPQRTFPDETVVVEMRQPGRPLDLYEDGQLVEAFREIGATYASISLHPARDLLYATSGSAETPLLERVRSEALRGARLLEAATGNAEEREKIEAMLAADADGRRLLRDAHLTWLRSRGRILSRRDASPEIERELSASVAALERTGYASFACPSIELLAEYWETAGDLERAYAFWQRALACRQGRSHPSFIANVERRTGIIHYENADYGEAERLIVSSLRLARLSEDPDALSRSLDLLSMTRAKQGSFADAESLMHASSRIAKAIYEPALDLARESELADLYAGIGEHGLARTHIREARRLGEEIRANPRFRGYYNYDAVVGYNLSLCAANEARILLAEGDRPAAFSMMREALVEAERSKDRAQRIEVARRLGEVCAAIGDTARATREIERSIAEARSRKRGDLESAALVTLGEIRLAGGDLRPAAGRFEQALAAARSGRHPVEEIRALRALARARRGLGDPGGSAGLLREAIGVFRRETAERRFIGNRHALSECVDAALGDLVEIECERSRPADTLLALAEEARALRSGDAGAGRWPRETVDALLGDRSWIPPGAVVVQHLVTDRTLVVLTLDRSGSACLVSTIPRDSLEGARDAFLEAAADSAAGSALAAASRALYRMLIEPAARRIDGAGLLCFVPDEALRRVPFAALAPAPDAPYLVESRAVLESPDLISLARPAVRPAGGRSGLSLLVGRPDPSPCVERRYPALRLLAHAQGELLEVARLVEGARVLAGTEATKEAILAALPEADRIHVATHTVAYPLESGRTALLASPPEGCDPDQPIEASLITEEDIRRGRFRRAPLVFLSACESAGGDAPGFGMAGAFLDAGALAVVAAIRPIGDRAAAAFAAAFYRELRGADGDAAAALQRVQKRFIEEARRGAAPAISGWAPFIALGSLERGH